MGITLNDDEVLLAARAIESFVQTGIPEERIRRIALGELDDPEFDQMRDLRTKLSGLAQRRIVIGRHAYDYLLSIEWDEEGLQRALQQAHVTTNRVTVRASSEHLNLIAQVLDDAADELMTSNKLASRRLRTASQQALAASGQ